MTELKPCPFCGGEAAVILDDRTWIECMDCPQKAGVGPFDTDAQAIAAWNTRAAEEGKAELVEALENAISLIAHKVGMDATAMVAGQTLVAREVWSQGMAALARYKEIAA